jgi:hypothetical protein
MGALKANHDRSVAHPAVSDIASRELALGLLASVEATRA